MPLFDFACRACGHRFEDLVRGDEPVTCPRCSATGPERLPSTFAVRGQASPPAAPPPCGSCGDPRGPGACALD